MIPFHYVLAGDDRNLQLKVMDFGPGFDQDAEDGAAGLGLISMQERARQAGGSVQIASKLGEETTVTVDPPLNRMRKTVLIADDHTLMLEGLTRLLATEYDVVGVATNGRLLLEEAQRLNPDVIVIDVGMPEMNGIEAARRLAKSHPSTRLVFVTQQLAPEYLRAAFAAGARAYVAKQSAANELIEAIRVAIAGRYYVTPLARSESVSAAKLNPNQNPAELFGSKLTPRQREVLQLVAEGKSTKEISVILGISTKTVEFHRNSLMDELGIRTIAELTRYAVAQGMIKA